MKKYKIYSLSLGLLFSGLCISCSGYLDKEPPLAVTETDVYGSPERLEGAILGMYSDLKSGYVLGGKMYIAMDFIGDEFEIISSNGYQMQATFDNNVGRNSRENGEIWQYVYRCINSVNTVLDRLPFAQDVAGDNYNQYIAEAKFIRAVCYFYLNTLWSMPYMMGSDALSVPLRLKCEEDLSDNALARSTNQQVYDQIFSDLAAVSDLPVSGNNMNSITRATQAAVNMLKMRAYMAMERWQDAINCGESISGYELLGSPADVFAAPYINNEMIFSLPMSNSNRNTGNAAVPSYYYNGTSAILHAGSIYSETGYGLDADNRVAALKGSANSNAIILKFPNGSTGLDYVPVFRYAETLLNLSECYFNLGNETKAKELLLQVRRRSLSEADDVLNFNSMQGSTLRTAIYNERRLEFIGEGIRGMDQMRRRETIVKMKGTNLERSYSPEVGTNGYIYPIPQTERTMNNLIVD